MTPPQGQFQHFETDRHGFSDHGLGERDFSDYVQFPGWVRKIAESHGFGDHGYGDHGFDEYVQYWAGFVQLPKAMASVTMVPGLGS
eukprot:g7490.t1